MCLALNQRNDMCKGPEAGSLWRTGSNWNFIVSAPSGPSVNKGALELITIDGFSGDRFFKLTVKCPVGPKISLHAVYFYVLQQIMIILVFTCISSFRGWTGHLLPWGRKFMTRNRGSSLLPVSLCFRLLQCGVPFLCVGITGSWPHDSLLFL